jgi:competence protein ComEC
MGSRVRPTLALCLLLVLAGCLGPADVGDQVVDTTATSTPTTQPTPAASTLSVHFLNVGQGNSVLVVGPTNETMLVDTGHWEDDGEHVIAALERLGIDRVDYLVTSHADADHIGGHAAVIDHFETQGDGVGAIYDPGIAASSRTYEAYLNAVERHEIPLYRTLDGDSIPLASANVDVLAPPEGYLADDDRNENSLVLRVRFGDISFVLPGDAGKAGEEYLLDEHGSRLSGTVLQAGHHGSASSTDQEFLDRVDPQVAVISSAYDSPYGHPHEEVLDRLAARSIRTYWTAVHGTVAVTTDGRNLTVATQRDATTDPRSLYGEPALAPGATDPLRPRVELSGNQLRTVAPTTPAAETRTVTGTQTVTDGGTEQPEGQLAVAEINADAAADDHENLDDEYVIFENAGDEPLDLSGWTVTDDADHVYRFPDGTTLGPDERLTLYTGEGADGEGELYWGANAAVWNNDGDAIHVHDASGRLVLEVSYP